MKLLVGMLYTLLPELVLFTAAALLAASTFSGAGQLAAELGAAAILVTALGLSAQFNRSRMFFALLALLSAYVALYALARITDPLAHAGVAGALSLFLPLDILVFSAIPERGVFSRYGGLWFGLLALEFVSLWMLVAFPSLLLAHALHVEFTHSRFLSFEPVTQPGMLLLGLGLLWLNDRLLSRHSAETAAFFLALVVALPVLHTPLLARAAVFLGAAGLGYGYAVIQESWTMAYLDELTGLPGRRALEEQMRQLGGRYAIAMVDVDHFKRFNDSYGHDVGDQVLRFVASRLQQPGLIGRPFRYGGEEFSVLYAGYGLAGVRGELETLRTDIEACRFDLRQRGRRSADGTGVEAGPVPEMLSITVSIGAAESGMSLKEPWAVLKAADKALYAAKHAGRNRVIAGTG
jgi:diguanylate cyclase (GGDEF)-like protein